jgi:Uma2 family endonuclease
MGAAGILGEHDRVELIGGEIIVMAPIRPPHAGAVKRLSNRIKLAVGERAIVATQDPLRIDLFNEPEPDIALLRPREDYYSRTHPAPADILLIVEVAETSLRYDREVKNPLYARAGIPEVWLVDIAGKTLWIHREPQDDRYRDLAPAGDLAHLPVGAMPDTAVDLTGVFGK